MQTLKFKRFSYMDQSPIQLTYGSEKAAGLDLYANEEAIVTGLGSLAVTTGIALKLPEGTVGLIWARSGLSLTSGIDVAAGVVDEDYTGPIKVLLRNTTKVPFKITKGMRIAQLLVQPIVRVEVTEVEELEATERGEGGFGSTGK